MARKGREGGAADRPDSAGESPGAPSRSAPATGTVVVTARSLRFAYDLATGHWTIDGLVDGFSWRCEATSRVDLVTPLGQLEERDVASATLVSCRETSAPGEVTRRLEVWRAWPDGLAVGQRFVVWTDVGDCTVELVVRAPATFRPALRSLTPLAIPTDRLINLQLRSESSARIEPLDWRILDIGWVADEVARIVSLLDEGEVVATGFAALGADRVPFELVMGLLDPGQAIGQYQFRRGEDTTGVGVTASAALDLLDLGAAEVHSGPLWLLAAPWDRAIPRFIDRWHATHPGRGGPPLVQWHLPARNLAEMTESFVLDELAMAATWEGLTSVDAATLDPGWPRGPGDWTVDPLRFPHGLRAIRDAMHEQELRAGLRLAPFLVSRESAAFRLSPTSVVRSPAVDPVEVAPGEPTVFALDLTQDAVLARIRALGRQIVEEWGFDLVEAAELDQSVVSGWRADGTVSPIAAYRRGLQTFRSALSGRLLIAAEAPLFSSVDLVDGLLTTAVPLRRADAGPLLRTFLHALGASTGPAPVLVNAPDQTIDEARAAATIASFGGGLITLGDDLGSLPPERSEVLRVCLPPCHGLVPFPIDRWTPGGPRLFASHLPQPEDDYYLIVALNPADVSVAETVSLARAGIPPGRYHAFEFWSQSYLGVVSDRVVIERIAPGGCAVVALRLVRNEPQVIGTSLHVSMGGWVIQAARFDPRACRLQVVVGEAGTRQGTITVSLPRRWIPGPIRGTGGAFSVRQPMDGLAVVELRFKDVAELELEFWPNSARSR